MKSVRISFALLGVLCIILGAVGWNKWGVSHDTLVLLAIFWGAVMLFYAERFTEKK